MDVREAIKKKLHDFNKKGFLIEIDDYELKYIRLSDPIVFLLNGEEAYEAYPELRRTGRFSNGYVVHCVEFK